MKVKKKFEMESGQQAYIEKGWWVEFPLKSPWAGPGKPRQALEWRIIFRIDQQEMM